MDDIRKALFHATQQRQQQQRPTLALVAPIQHPIGPVATGYAFGNATGTDGKTVVVVQMSTPSGVQLYFFDPDFAEKMFTDGLAAARRAGSGIVVATPVPPVG